MHSLEQSSLQPLLVDDRGQVALLHVCLGKGLFLLSPLGSGGPGLSTIFTDVPIGPGFLITTSLSILASLESLVAGIAIVAVAPELLNQVDLSSFAIRLLSCLVL